MGRKIGVILSYATMVLQVFSTLFLTPFILSALGQAEYGVYQLTISINSFLLLLDLGVGNATVRFIAKYRSNNDKESESKFLGVVTLFYVFIALLVIAIGAILYFEFPKIFGQGLNESEVILGQKLFSISMISSAITLGSTAFANVIIAYERFGIQKGAAMIEVAVRIVLSVVVLLAGFGSFGLVLANLFTSTCSRIFYVYYVLVRMGIRPKIHGANKAFIGGIINYSAFVLLQMIATQINQSIGSVLLGAFVDSSAVVIAVYSVGLLVTQYLVSIGSSIKGVVMPGIVGMVEGGASDCDLVDEMIKIGRLTFVVVALVLFGFLSLGQMFISLWVGSDYSEAYFVALILMAAQSILLPLSVGQYVLWAFNDHKALSIVKIVIVLMNTLLTITLIQWNPLFGTTLGTFISLFLGDIVTMFVILRKKISMKILNYCFKVYAPSIGAGAISACGGFAVSCCLPCSWTSLFVGIAVVTIIFGVVMLFFGFNSYEKCLITGIFRKVKKSE